MEIYVARQPIFDRGMEIYGYELLYRKSMNNYYEGDNDTISTAELINHAFFNFQFKQLTEGKKAFINFSEEMLIKKIPFLLPKDAVVIEVLERIKSSIQLKKSCQLLKKEGYTVALDDFVATGMYEEIIPEVNIIKIEFPRMDLSEQKRLIKKYKGKVRFLAEKVETREEFEIALNMGYDYFQGFFFSKPLMIKGKEISALNATLVKTLMEVGKQEPDYQKISEAIELDVGLSYKMLKIANSVFFGSHNQIHSIKTAVVRLGINELRKWIYIMMLKDVQHSENVELIKNSLIRAKMMEYLAIQNGQNQKHLEYFLTGLFSTIDVLLNRPMKEVLNDLSLTEDINRTLLGETGEMREILDFIIHFEKAQWWYLEEKQKNYKFTREEYMNMYMNTLCWVSSLDLIR